MTRPVCDRILKDANGDISDHLSNHIHLTNCIHLKNHMHKHSPILADRSLRRDLIVLQRSRSLWDPSASPPPRHSPSVVDLLPKKGGKNVVIRDGRRAIGERRRDSSRFSGHSPLPNFVSSKVAPGEVGLNNGVAAAISERSGKSGNRDGRRVRREDSRRKSRTDFFGGNEEVLEQDGNDFIHTAVSWNSEFKERQCRQKGKKTQAARIKKLSEQLNDSPMDSDDLVSSNVQFLGRCCRLEKTGEEHRASIRGYSHGLNRVKRRCARRTRAPSALRDVGGWSEMSVASNSLAQGSARLKYQMEEEEEYGAHNVTRAPRNGCGIPWNWSRIHHSGKTFLDMAGRSLTSCGLSDSRLRKAVVASHGRDVPDMPVASDHSSSSTKSDAEALPLLVEASGSQSTGHADCVHDYSGELGIFADRLLKHDTDSGLPSEGRSGDRRRLGANRNGRQQNLTQKYMPRTFRDLVGQKLVAQALSNAVMRRKVGLLYVFYGPHGTGKTSCTRIFAQALNCQSLEQPKPCGFCNSCISHDMGKSQNIKEVGPVSNYDFQSILDLLDKMVSQLPTQYKIFVFDDCDSLSPDCWSAISKVIDRATRRVVFVLVCSSLDALPHIIISRCQKFFFPKLKDADIIYTLQWIASKEDIEIDKDALKLIASRSDGSLRDAEMTLEQLSLLGQRISVPLVQQLVGLISDEKLVDLLDLALSADTVNTVKILRVIMETGVEPLALMSQLATVITDILAGSYDFTKDSHRRKFFRRQPLSKEEMEKLRQALKTLSESEKQLRISNDKLTCLTAALLQLAPDQQYVLPSSSADTSFSHSPFALENAGGKDMPRKSAEISNKETGIPVNVKFENFHIETSGGFIDRSKMKGISLDRKRHAGPGTASQQKSLLSTDAIRVSDRQIPGRNSDGIEEIWLEVLDKIQNNRIKEFLLQEGKSISVSFGSVPTVQLTFSSHLKKSKAEKFKDQILQAFEFVFGSPLTIEIRCESKTDTQEGFHPTLMLPATTDGSSQMVIYPESNIGNRGQQAGPIEVSKRVPIDRGINGAAQQLHAESLQTGKSEIVEIPASPRETKDNVDNKRSSFSEGRLGEPSQSQSIVRSKVSLAHVIQQAEGCTQRNGWSKCKAVSIAEKLEQENLRLEPRSRSLLCWKAARGTRRKLSRLKIRTRKPHSLIKLFSCGKCLSSRSPRWNKKKV